LGQKGMDVRIVLRMALLCQCLLAAGCASMAVPSRPPRVPLRVRFEPGRTLAYVFTSHRDIQVQWQPGADAGRARGGTRSLSETLTLDMTFEPVTVTDTRTVLKVTCRSARVRRTGITGRPPAMDPVERMTGRTYTLTVDARGRITDAKSLDALLKDIGRRAFREHPTQGRIKDPEMIADVVATQWFLWDAVASADPNGEAVGDTWLSRLSVPTPMVMRKARDVTYTLADVNDADHERIATIDSTCRLSPDKAPRTWPIPYAARFQVSGQFGFLRGYQVLSLTGQGRERFNVDDGVSLGYEQTYHMEIQAMVPFMAQVRPEVIIDQTLTMEPAKN